MFARHHLRRPPDYQRQSGAVAVLVGIALLAMVGISGLALDLGKLYVAKSELQNSADACALAAAQELTGANDNQLLLAEAAGSTAGSRNKVLFQASAITYSDASAIEFSADNSAGSYASRSAVTASAKSIRYARCTATRSQIPTWFIQVLAALPGGQVDAQQVSASATATLKPSQSTCSLPVGICSNVTALTKGNWYMGAVDPNDTQGNAQSVFKWIDFTPPNGGATEIAEQLRGGGACDVPATGAYVGESGAIASLANDYNTRFGIYQGNTNGDDSPPDSSGYAYNSKTWIAGANAFSDFAGKRGSNAPYQGDNITGLKTHGSIKDAGFLKANGQDRRVMPAPLIDCSNVVNNKMPITSWGCFFLLHPMSNNLGGGSGGAQYPRMMLEYLGGASESDSPCASYGLPGGSNAAGPLVATLVR